MRILLLGVSLLGLLLMGCGREAKEPEDRTIVVAPAPQEQPGAPTGAPQREGEVKPGETGFLLTSSAFENGKTIPKKYTADGESVSPPLTWNTPPQNTKELVVIMRDPDAPGGTFYHWTIYGITPSRVNLPENVLKTAELPEVRAMQGVNSANRVGYFPPSPPPGKPHRYIFRIYALKDESNLPPRATPQEVERAVKNLVLVQGELMGRYGR